MKTFLPSDSPHYRNHVFLSPAQGCQMAVATVIFRKCSYRKYYLWPWLISGREWP
jgi:hypothetical protein